MTTGIGLGSLYVSDIEPIRKFGVFSALGVFLMLIMLFLLLPAALQMWPARAWLPKEGQGDDDSHKRHDPHAGTIWSEQVWATVLRLLDSPQRRRDARLLSCSFRSSATASP